MTIAITGTGSALPEKIVTNFDLEKLVETTDEWIQKRTGIAERRISDGETVSTLAAGACKKALEMAGKTADEVDLILVATCSPEMLLPCCACQVQELLGASGAAAFDLNAACSGFLFALNTAYAYLHAGIYRNALVVGSEVLSKLVDWKDRGTCILFGDGAGAAFVEAGAEAIIRSNGRRAGMECMVQGADGTKGMVLSCAERAVNNAFIPERQAESPYIRMDGQEVYKFATKQVPACIQDALDRACCGGCGLVHTAPGERAYHRVGRKEAEGGHRKISDEHPPDRQYVLRHDTGTAGRVESQRQYQGGRSAGAVGFWSRADVRSQCSGVVRGR